MDRAPVVVAVGLLLAAAPPAPCHAQAQDPATVSELAQLLSLEDRRVFDHAVLQRAAQHPQAVIRRRAAMAMGRLRDRAATALLLSLVADADTGVAAEAAFAIGQLGDPRAAEELARRSEAWPLTGTGPVEAEVVTALAKLGDRRSVAALEGILRRHPPEQSESDRATATVLLEAWRLTAGGGALTERLLAFARAANAEWRRHAVYSLARLREPRAAPVMVDATGESDPLTRAYAARALSAQLADSSGTSRELFVSRLTALLGDESGQVRVNALRALATFRDSSLWGAVATRLTDRDPNVPVQATLTLGALGGSRAAALLADRAALRGGAGGGAGTFALRRAALLGLAQAEAARVSEFAEAWGAHSDWRYRASFAEALGVAATPDARERLMTLADDADARVAATALGALGQAVPAGDGPLRALVRGKLAHADVIVRALATQLLSRERDGDLVAELIVAYRRAERDEWSDARLAAVSALAQVAESSPAAWDRVERDFLAAVGRSRDFLVRRAVAERFGADLASRYWGEPYPVETGRSTDDYREIVRRYLLEGPGGPTPSLRLSIETERGRIVVALYPQDAPLTVEQFTRLVARRFFDGSRWHRVVPNFVIQDGDPRGDGNGGPSTTVRDEVNRRRYDRGAVGVALSGPDTGGSQFFITHSPQPHLDGTYTVFAHVVEGYDVLDLVVQGDRIVRIVP